MKQNDLVTYEQVKSIADRDCPEPLEFSRLFPDGARLTLENIRLASEHQLSIGWWARRSLTRWQHRIFAQGVESAKAEYNEVTQAAWDARVAAIDKAITRFDASIKAVENAYIRKADEANATYQADPNIANLGNFEREVARASKAYLRKVTALRKRRDQDIQNAEDYERAAVRSAEAKLSQDIALALWVALGEDDN